MDPPTRPSGVTPGGYSTDALFEDLELVRTIRAAGGREARADDLFVRRLSCTAAARLRQRVRQAYDSVAQPTRLLAELGVLPALVLIRPDGLQLAGLACGVAALAELGRRRRNGRAVYPPAAALWAPLWLAQRSLCSWLAVLSSARGGVRYTGGRMRLAAHSERQVRRRVPAIRRPDGPQEPPPVGRWIADVRPEPR